MGTSRSVTGILLSSGFSSRMGAFKPLLEYNGEYFCTGIIRKLAKVCSQVIIVTGYNSALLIDELKEKDILNGKVAACYNSDYEMGMFSSLQAGIRALRNPPLSPLLPKGGAGAMTDLLPKGEAGAMIDHLPEGGAGAMIDHLPKGGAGAMTDLLAKGGAEADANSLSKKGELLRTSPFQKGRQEGFEWVIVHMVDQPDLPEEFYKRFVTCLDDAYDWIQPQYNGRKGHPIAIRSNLFNQIISASKEATLRTVFSNEEIKRKLWECSYDQILTDIDTPDDYSKLIKHPE